MKQASTRTDKFQHLMLWLLVITTVVADVQGLLIYQDVTYDELEALDATCNVYDNCQISRTDDVLLDPYTCNCDKSCVKFDTCCVDSEFRKSPPSPRLRKLKCIKVYGSNITYMHMVDRCKRNWSEDLVRDLCHGDAESMNDPMLLVPVTSQMTGITYKNYFCSVCNDDHTPDAPTLWNLKVSGRTAELRNSTAVPSVSYSSSLKSWEIISPSQSGSANTVSLTVEVPERIRHMTKKCHLNLISNCSREWTDAVVRQKCAAYMAHLFIMKNTTAIPYRNPHCAVCNFENLNNMVCFEAASRVSSGSLNKVMFVSLFVLDDKPKKCGSDEVYDSLAKKCRVLRCPRNQSAKKGQCVAD